jgi:hypothetical protein
MVMPAWLGLELTPKEEDELVDWKEKPKAPQPHPLPVPEGKEQCQQDTAEGLVLDRNLTAAINLEQQEPNSKSGMSIFG